MERMYRSFWYRKGDVFALLWDMQRCLPTNGLPACATAFKQMHVDVMHAHL